MASSTLQNTPIQKNQNGTELNVASGGAITCDSGSSVTLNGTTTFGAVPITSTGNGAVNGATVSATEYVPIVHRTVITLTATPVAVADATTGGGVKIYDFPEGRIQFLGATGSIIFTTTTSDTTTLNASKTANWGIGSVTQANGTLATTEQDIIPTTNYTTAAQNVASTVSKAALAATFQLDGTSTPVDAFLNIGVAGATDIDGDATVTATGSVTITWVNLGDY